MKGLVIYKGRYGATKQYAVWIGQELQLTVASADRFPTDELSKYDYFILGSSVYIGKLEIKNWLAKNLGVLLNKKIFLFQVAGTPAALVEKRKTYNEASVPKAIIKQIDFFYLPGRMIMRNLSRWDRFLLKLGARLAKDVAEKERMLTDFDAVKKENTMPLVEYLRKYLDIKQPEIEYI